MTKIRIETIQAAQQQLAQAQTIIDREVEALDRESMALFNTRWQQTFGNIEKRALGGMRGGCHTTDWKPEIYVYHVADCEYTNIGVWISRNHESTLYEFNLDRKPAPIDKLLFDAFCERFVAETGVTITLVTKQVKQKPDRLLNETDVRAYFGPSFEIVSSGKIWSVGWDIPDFYVLGKLEGKFIAVYSTDGHGFGMEEEARTWAEFDRFFDYLTNHGLGDIRGKFAALIARSFD